jgi:hypothetical protein
MPAVADATILAKGLSPRLAASSTLISITAAAPSFIPEINHIFPNQKGLQKPKNPKNTAVPVPLTSACSTCQREKVSDLGYLFLDKSSLHIIA